MFLIKKRVKRSFSRMTNAREKKNPMLLTQRFRISFSAEMCTPHSLTRCQIFFFSGQLFPIVFSSSGKGGKFKVDLVAQNQRPEKKRPEKKKTTILLTHSFLRKNGKKTFPGKKIRYLCLTPNSGKKNANLSSHLDVYRLLTPSTQVTPK